MELNIAQLAVKKFYLFGSFLQRNFFSYQFVQISLTSAFPNGDEKVQVETVLALPRQHRPHELQRPEPGERHPVERLRLVPHVRKPLRANWARGCGLRNKTVTTETEKGP